MVTKGFPIGRLGRLIAMLRYFYYISFNQVHVWRLFEITKDEEGKVNFRYPIDQFRYIKIQPKTIVLNTRLWGINTEFVGFIPKSLVLRSFVLG